MVDRPGNGRTEAQVPSPEKAGSGHEEATYPSAMINRSESLPVGLDYLRAVTTLLNRIRTTHPTAGLFEAADPQWWWSQYPRPTDDLGQLFWLDDQGRPEAAAILTDFGGEAQLDPLVLPDATPDTVAHVMGRGLDHAREAGYETVTLEVDRADAVLRAVLDSHGFAIEDDGLIEAWLTADARPPISPLHEGYELVDRRATGDRPHHMTNERRNHIDPESRLRQTSLYRPDLDLAVYADDGSVAAYGLFWYDPTTEVGLVEPMRTEDEHQRHGLAGHILTSGVDRLAAAGAKRIKICFEPANEPARRAYLGAGFVPDRENDLFTGPTGARSG